MKPFRWSRVLWGIAAFHAFLLRLNIFFPNLLTVPQIVTAVIFTVVPALAAAILVER